MADRTLFANPVAPTRGRFPRATTTNRAGGKAHARTAEQALAQLAVTGTLHDTYYTDARGQFRDVVRLAGRVDDRFLARLAVYARTRGFLKDLPVALTLLLFRRETGGDKALAHRVFDRVVDNGRTLRTFVKLVRSGRFGARGLSGSPRRAVRRWLNAASVGKLLSASVGRDPSLRDVLRLARPTPPDDARRAVFGRLVGKPPAAWGTAVASDLPREFRVLDAYRNAATERAQVHQLACYGNELPARWDLLASAAKGPAVWERLARGMGHQALRMNLNTLARHGTFDRPGVADFVARRLSDPAAVRRARQFPFQYLAAYHAADAGVPAAVRGALSAAADAACGNVPALPGPVLIGVDVSGSMQMPVTGFRGRGSSSAVRCVDAAATFAAAVLRKNPGSVLVPFDHAVHAARFDPGDTLLSIADRLAAFGGGGTDCSLPLAHANRCHRTTRFAGCVLVSDCESWVGRGRRGSTPLMTEWATFAKARMAADGSGGPKLVCIDLAPNTTVQAPDRADVLNVGGFSDAVFGVVAAFLAGGTDPFVDAVRAVDV